MPDISDIPQSAQLEQQLALLNQAIAALHAGGTINFLTVQPVPPPDAQPPPLPPDPIRVNLDPPITDPGTLGNVADDLQTQADGITNQLTAMGYTNNPPA